VWGAWQALAPIHLVSALELNERARRCCADEAIPRAMLIQQADLMRLLGKDAKRLEALAEKAPVRPFTEDAYWTASALAAKGDCKGALPLLNQAVSEAPDHYGALLLRGVCLTPRFPIASSHDDQTNGQKALECFTTCIVMRPNNVWAYYNRGLVSYYLGLKQNAVADFDRLLQKESLEKHPACATAYVQRATAWRELREFEEAESDLTKAIALEPNVTEYFYLRARIRKELKKDADARLDERQVLDLTPATAEGWTYRGMVRFGRDPQGALADFDKALAIEPEGWLTLHVKGCVLAQVLKRNKEAVQAFDKALTIRPDYVEAHIARGLAYAALGERTLALQDADAALESQPANPQVHYEAARIPAQTSRRHPEDAKYALGLLAWALRHGYGVHSYRQEPDLAPLQRMPEFELLGRGLKYLNVP
jgi:tetratricopeptide (TPR) repeat protein